jgi:hypothetical protein
MATDLSTQLKAEGLKIAIEQLTKQSPTLQYFDDGHAEMYFKEEQIKPLQRFLEDVLQKAGKGKQGIKLHVEPILFPVMLKKALPFIVLLLVAGFVAGRISGK